MKAIAYAMVFILKGDENNYMENEIIAMGYYMEGVFDDEDMEIITLLKIYGKYYIMFEFIDGCTLELIESEKNLNILKRRWDLSDSKIVLEDFNDKYFNVLYQLMKEEQQISVTLSTNEFKEMME